MSVPEGGPALLEHRKISSKSLLSYPSWFLPQACKAVNAPSHNIKSEKFQVHSMPMASQGPLLVPKGEANNIRALKNIIKMSTFLPQVVPSTSKQGC
jgi:hypothetical protein